MAKEVSILIPNRDSYEALQLCVESIRKFTQYPHKIIVCDDNSSNKIDLKYLRECQDKGWIELYEHDEVGGHGAMLNRLTNDICDTRLAMIVDSDIQIRGHGWLGDMVRAISVSNNIIAVVDTMYKYIAPRYYRVPISNFWFGLINMDAYRDGMQVDWRNRRADRRREPFKTVFADHYPPDSPGIDWDNFKENQVEVDPGGNFWLQVSYFNPKGYEVIPLPDSVLHKYYHFWHITFISFPDYDNDARVVAERNAKFAQIRGELKKLRGNG